MYGICVAIVSCRWLSISFLGAAQNRRHFWASVQFRLWRSQTHPCRVNLGASDRRVPPFSSPRPSRRTPRPSLVLGTASDLPSCLSRTREEGTKNSVPHFCSAPGSSIRAEAKARPNSQVPSDQVSPNPRARSVWAELSGDPWAVSLPLASSLHHRAHGPWPASSSSHAALLDYVPTRVEVIVNLRKQNLSKFM